MINKRFVFSMTTTIIQAWIRVTPILVYWMEHVSESVTADFIASVRRASVDKSVTLVSKPFRLITNQYRH